MSDEQLRDERKNLERYKMDNYVKLGAYTTDVQGFFPYLNELKTSVFKFRDEDLKTAKSIIQSVTNTFKDIQAKQLE